MNVKNVMYEMKREFIYTLAVIAVAFAVWGILVKSEKEFNIMVFDAVVMNGIFFSSLIRTQLEEHMNFAFCRKSILKKQMILSLAKAICLSLARTAIQVVFYDAFVEMFMEDTDHTLSMYHKVPIFELFAVNVMVFMILYMITVVLATSSRKILSQKPSNTPKLRLRAADEKKLNLIVKIIIYASAFIVLIALEMGIIAYYWFQMLYQPIYRLLITLGIAALLAVICYIAKRRYSPSYI